MSENNEPTGGGLLQYVFDDKEQRRKFAQTLTGTIEGDISTERVFEGKLLSIVSLDRSNYTHGFHKYPAKYIPEIPRWAIHKFTTRGNVVLDPFCGSGTTNVEAKLWARNSYAIDVDPLARLLAKVKTTPLDEIKLRSQQNKLFNEIVKSNQSEIPSFPNRDYWFRGDVLEDLGIIYAAILRIEDRDVREFFLVVLSSILKEVSNADPKFLYALAISRHMRAKTKRAIDAKKIFIERTNVLVPKMIAFSKACSKESLAQIIGEDARMIQLADRTVNLVMTSPPYLNAVDYPRAHQLQLYWFGFWKGPLGELKRAYIGNEQAPATLYSKMPKYGNELLDSILKELWSIDKKRAYVVYQFFRDMRETMLEIKRVLVDEGHFCYAIADNLIRKIPVPTHTVIGQIAEELGFARVDSFGSVLMMRPHDMRPSEKMSAEWVMTFRK
ncbi:MAG TPA: DNA methyltransferase [Candidatus Bathyarchaeia archaeon]|nr:DNA methyltransferase [Candidatus Bathyarchaeia archaeon]